MTLAIHRMALMLNLLIERVSAEYCSVEPSGVGVRGQAWSGTLLFI